MNAPIDQRNTCCARRLCRRVGRVAAVGCMALITATIAAAAAWAQPSAHDQTAQFGRRARGIRKQVVQIEHRYVQPAVLESRFKVETRFNDAKVAYLLGDYERSAILFVGLVDNPRAKQMGSYPEALYLLADSLNQQRNYLAARKYFHKIVDRGRGEYRQKAVVELLEIAAKTGNYSGVDKLYQSLDSQASVSPAVNYVRGKTLYKQGEYAAARRYFQKAAQTPSFVLRANYFRAVSFAAEGQLDNAKMVFQDMIASDEARASDNRQMLELAYLGLGRIYYETEQYPRAVDQYAHVERTSPHFDQMLYELTWALIAQEKYQAASQVTDIFLYLSNPDPTFVPKVKLLRADLRLRLGQYELAKTSYDDVVATFTPVKKRLDTFVDDTRDLQTFFEDLVDAQVKGEKPDYMPELVQKWVDSSPAFDKAKTTMSDLSRVRQNIKSSYDALNQMEARLNSGARIESFPKLARGMSLAVELESKIIGLRRDMIAAQYEAASSAMTDAQRRQWKDLKAASDRLASQYDAIPKTRAQSQKRTRRIVDRFGDIKQDLDDVSFQIDSQQEQLDAIDAYLADGDRHEFTPEELSKLQAKRKAARQSIAQLRAMQSQIRHEIDLARQQVGVGDQVSTREDQIRDQYSRWLDKQRRFLAGIQPAGADPAEVRSARGVLDAVEPRLDHVVGAMSELADERAGQFQKSLDSERQMVTMLDREVARLMSRSKEVTAEVAYRGFVRVRHDFRDIIMRGDVGLIDVAWQKKEEKTRQINQLFEDRSAQLKSLQEAFEEVR